MGGRSADGRERRSMIGWVVFDLANVLFAISVLSLYFPLWIVDIVEGLDSNYSVACGILMTVVLVLATIVGAPTDRLPRHL